MKILILGLFIFNGALAAAPESCTQAQAERLAERYLKSQDLPPVVIPPVEYEVAVSPRGPKGFYNVFYSFSMNTDSDLIERGAGLLLVDQSNCAITEYDSVFFTGGL